MISLAPLRSALQDETSLAVILDLSGVSHMDSAGLGLLLQLNATYERTGQRLAVAGANERVRNLFEVTGISKIIPLYSTRADAEQALT